MTAAAPTKDKSSRLWNSSPTFSFLPPKGDFTIICTAEDDKRQSNTTASTDLGPNAFGVEKEALASRSNFFADMFELASDGTSDELDKDKGQQKDRVCIHVAKGRVHVQERSQIVGYVLSAALEPSRTHAASCKDWDSLNEALNLAIKWKLERARTGLFLAMQDRLLTIMQSPKAGTIKLVLVDFLVEAVREGDSALSMAKAALRSQGRASGHTYQTSIVMPLLRFSGIHFVDIGTEGCSKVAQVIIQMIQEGHHRCEAK